MFAGENIGLSFCRGWFPLFTQLCEEIDALLGPDKRGFHWVQLKEKFGSARFNWEMNGHRPAPMINLISGTQVTMVVRRSSGSSPAEADGSQPSIPRRIDNLVQQATLATRSLCIVCGKPGIPNQEEPWILVLCDEHAIQHRQGELESAWFDKEEQ
ncbi:hypothetical protein [Caenimonas soli]|uniref:hypothetical protein n=1 Tax=Caenimonas soli TaxID=2735555 RepID=UPI001551FD25|nr:hypothetical protein [Caenimonas soli]NPC59345.1 hypothetical protein [Caenimonas soli]